MRKNNAIIIKSRIIPKGYCVNLFGTFWARDTSWIDEKVMNHERIHTAQQKEMLFIIFYIVYLLEWCLRFLQYRDGMRAYVNISFEKEAYWHGDDLTYLARRRHFAQWRKRQ